MGNFSIPNSFGMTIEASCSFGSYSTTSLTVTAGKKITSCITTTVLALHSNAVFMAGKQYVSFSLPSLLSHQFSLHAF